MDRSAAVQRLTAIAADIEGVDIACYERHGQDPTRPVIGFGRADAAWCFFGRDPGEQEVRTGTPFVGPAGQKIRRVMAEFDVGDDDVYWMNTVPFKPVGNKAWSMEVRRRCRPALLDLFGEWKGSAVLTFGEAAFKWFALGRPIDRRTVEAHWARPDRFEASLAMTMEVGGIERPITLHPLPHPSGANAVWSSRFPHLLRARLHALGATPQAGV